MPKLTEKVRATRVEAPVGETVDAVAAKIRPRLSEADYARKLLELGFDEDGNQVPDPTPMEPPLGWQEPPSLVEIMRTMIREHELQKGMEGDFESFEEADDFDVGDENAEELRSGFENDFEPPEVEVIRKKVKAKKDELKDTLSPSKGQEPDASGSR